MREIKFRAWDKKNKEWIANGDVMDLYYSASVNCFMFDNDNYDLCKDIVFVQFTGLKDKNGKEIYEGDIVLQWDGIKGEITFEKYVTDNGANEDMLGWVLSTPEKNYAFDPQTSTAYEIIGNVWENPELLDPEEV